MSKMKNERVFGPDLVIRDRLGTNLEKLMDWQALHPEEYKEWLKYPIWDKIPKEFR